MPITVNGSGTITGVSVGGLPDGIVDTDMLAANAVTDAKQNLSGPATAWINFDGTSASIGSGRDSFNVGSVTDNGTGDYTITFSTAMASTNYAAFAHTSRNPVGAATGDRLALIDMSLSSASAVRCKCTNSDASANSSLIDCEFVAVAVFGG